VKRKPCYGKCGSAVCVDYAGRKSEDGSEVECFILRLGLTSDLYDTSTASSNCY